MDGCSSHNCYIRKPQGQGTNSGCTCLRSLGPNELAVKRKLARLKKLEGKIQEWRSWYYSDLWDGGNAPYQIIKEILEL